MASALGTAILDFGAARYPALLPVTVPIDKRRRQSKAMALLLATRNL